MRIYNPYLRLTFTEDNSNTKTSSIQLDSIQMSEQLLNDDLSSSSNTVQLNLVPDETDLIDDILATDRDIKAKLYDGDPDEPGAIPLFTGYVSDSFSWAINQTGEDVFQLKLEDVGSRALNRSWSSEDDVMVRMTLQNLVTEIATKAGDAFTVTWDSSVSSSIKSSLVINRFDGSKTIQDIMDEVCFEFGLVYYFNADGNMVIRTMDITSNASYDIYSTGNHTYLLYTENGNAISFSRKARQYSQSKIKFSTLEDSTDEIPIFDVTDTVQVPSGHWWDGADHSESIYEQTLDDFFQSGKTYYTESGGVYTAATVTVGDPVPTSPIYYEYAGTLSQVDMVDLEKGKDIIYVYSSEIHPNLTNQTTSYTYNNIDYVAAPTGFQNSKWTIRQHPNSGKLDVLIDNTQSATSVFYTAFKATGRIIRKISEANVIKAAEGLVSNSDVTFTYEAQWIHDRTLASNLADLLNKWYLYCGMSYTFYSKDSFPLGSMVQVNENLWSDTVDKLLLMSRSYTMNGQYAGLYKYTARAVSPFNLKTVTTEAATIPQMYVPEVKVDVDPLALNLSVSQSFVEKNLRETTSQRVHIYASSSGQIGNIGITVSDNTTAPYTVTQVTANEEWYVDIPYQLGTSVTSIIIDAIASEISDKQTLSVNDVTEYHHFFGAQSSASSITAIKVEGDYYLNTTDGKTYRWNGTSWVDLQLIDENSAQEYLTALNSALNNDPPVPLETLNNPNTVSWFNTILAAKAVIDSLFSRYITILDRIDPDTQQTKYGCIRSEAYDNDGNYVGSGQGFFLNSQGILKCYSADLESASARNITITGNSAFHGKFDCDIIRTEAENPSSYYDTTNGSVADVSQAKRIVDQLILEGLIADYGSYTTSPYLPASIIGVTSDVAFIRVDTQKATQSGTDHYLARIHFYNSSMTELNIRNIVTCTVSGGTAANFLYSSNLDASSYRGQYAVNGINLRIYTGQDRLWVDVPDVNSASVLSSGMLFRGTTATTISGVSGYPLYVKA